MRLIQQTDDMHVLGLNVLFYGDPGIGKTTLAFTAPNPFYRDWETFGIVAQVKFGMIMYRIGNNPKQGNPNQTK